VSLLIYARANADGSGYLRGTMQRKLSNLLPYHAARISTRRRSAWQSTIFLARARARERDVAYGREMHTHERISANGRREGKREAESGETAGCLRGLDGYFTFEGLVNP